MVAIDRRLRDIALGARIIHGTHGFSMGLMQFTYQVFLYEHFGANPTALKITVGLYMLMSVGIVLLEIPTGAWGDHVGRKRTLAVRFAIAGLAFFCRGLVYFMDSIFLSLCTAAIAAILSALCYTLYSGTFTAWVVDAARERHADGGHGPILAAAYSSMMGGKILGAMLGLWLYLSGFVVYACGLAGVVSMLCALYIAVALPESTSLVFSGHQRLSRDAIVRMKAIVGTGWHVAVQNPAIRYMVCMYAGFMLIVHLVNALWPIAMRDNFGVTQMSVSWYIVVFCGMTSAFLGAKLVSAQTRRLTLLARCDHPRFLWNRFATMCVVLAAAILALGFCKTRDMMSLPIFVDCFIIFNCTYGFLMPAFETLLNTLIPENNSQARATINSIAPMLTETLLLLLALPSSGAGGDTTVIGWMIPAAILLALTGVVHWRLRPLLRPQSLSPNAQPTTTSP